MKTTDEELTITSGGSEVGSSNLSTKELLGRIVEEGTALVRKEMELAKSELLADVKAEVRVVKALGAGAILGLCGLNLALVTVVLALSLALPGWAAGLIVTAVVLAAAGIVAAVGWRRRVRTPLERTRKHLKEDVKWMKERVV
jgi:Putative Actinobacterial Holin-X, holin superfamily III